MRLQLNPSVPEISLVNSDSLDEAVAQLIVALTPGGGGFNYLRATKVAKAAYKGFHNLSHLVAAHNLHDGSVGAVANLEVANMVCPVSFGRRTQVIDIPSKSFQYGANRHASFRVPFLFLEEKTVKSYFLQPRKRTVYTEKQVGIFASIVKKYLLDTEFYGEKVDIEFVEASERVLGQGRELRVQRLSDIDIVSDEVLAKHLSVVQDALKIIENENLVTKKRRPLRDRDLPLFF
ncbi:hypothetical protein [Agrobacterium tumefaciens]|uniref:hypothetical protein n=1 Tax=Agrobacterium tumefaciens TaxID=358 RepID=UPI0009BB2710|nr:hypothetical protein [Agrobacterium tumefaciens]